MAKANYKAAIEQSFRHFYNTHNILTEDLYGVIYHFFKEDLESDSDNLSKPFWDCLNGFLFTDDRQVKLRIAGSFDITKNDLNILNFTEIPGVISADLIEAFDTETHVVYVEVGVLDHSMFKFNLEANGN